MIEQLDARLQSVKSIELDNAFYVEDGTWIESLTIATNGEADVVAELNGISGTEVMHSRAISTGPTDVSVTRTTVLSNESYPFILGLVLRQEAIPNRLFLSGSEVEVVVTAVDWDAFRALADEVQDKLGKFELQSVKQIENPGEPLDSGRLTEVLIGKLTNDQLEALETAYELGYFEVPRKATATEVADMLDVSQSTLSERIRSAERNILQLIYGPRDA